MRASRGFVFYHFGEAFELNEAAKKLIPGYLQTNAAEHSSAKRASES